MRLLGTDINFVKFSENLLLIAVFVLTIGFNSGNNPDVNAASEASDEVLATSVAEKVTFGAGVKSTKTVKNTSKTQSAATVTTPNASKTNNTTPVTTSVKKPVKPVVNAGIPKFISINGLISSPIYTVGLTSGGAIDVPGSAVGWWNGSSKPGTTGAVFLDGHTPGVLSNLKNVQIGAIIKITMGDNSVIQYKVVDKQIYDYDAKNPSNPKNMKFMEDALFPRGGSKGLNLMTCHGVVVGNTYSQRLVVFAQQI